MKRVPGAVLPLIALVILAGSGAGGAALAGVSGTIQGHPWVGSRGLTQSVGQIAARQRREDRRTGGRPKLIQQKPEPGEGDEEEREEREPKAPGAATPHGAVPEAGEAVGPSAALETGTSFLGATSSESGFIPPDSMGAVGPTQVVVAVNGRIKVFDKQGNLGPLNVTDANFFTPVRNGSQVTDPQVEYDRLSGRWFISMVNLENNNNRVMLAVSSGPTITASSDFTFYFFNHNTPPPAGDNGRFADYPQMGVDKNAVYIGVNLFQGSNFSRTAAFVIRKSSVVGGGPIVVTAFRNLAVGTGSGPFTPQPAQDMDPNVEQGYIVGVDNAVFSQLDVRRISDPGGTPTMSGDLPVSVPATYFPLPVPAQGTSNNLDALDDRLFEAMIARKPSGQLSLWTAHNIRVNSSGASSSIGDRTASRWYELGTLPATPSLVQSGTLFDSAASNPRFFWIPSIAASGQGHASLNASAAGSGRFAEVASTGRLLDDTLGTLLPFEITQSSSSTYNLGSGTTKRWGDYSQTVVDPTDNMTFWSFQEYANATNSWGLRVIQRKPPPPAVPSAASPAEVPLGTPSVSTQITGTSVDGSGFFDPGPDTGGPGYPKHIDASVTGGVQVNSVTYTDPTHVTLGLDTTGASSGAQDVTITNPDGQSSSAADLLTVGADTIPPAPPTVSGTSPASPANDNSPKVLGSAEAGSTVKLYATAACTGSPAATGSAAAFSTPGITVPVADDSTTTFRATATDAATNASSCSSSSTTYVEDSTPPAAPAISSTSPVSPSNNSQPLVKGTASSDTVTVRVFTQASCAGGSTNGSKATFEGAGIQVTVGSNATTTLSAKAVDAAGNASTCSSGLSYTHDNIAPAAPAITSTNPASPSNSSTTPNAIGTSSSDTATVRVFTQAACAGGFTSGSKAGFEGSGIQVTVGANQTTQLSARALDAAGNPSPCSSNLPYTHDNLAPSAPSSLAVTPTSPANDNAPKVSGAAEAGSTVRLYRAATASDCTPANEAVSGTASAFSSPGLTVSVLNDTTTTLRATAADAAGNVSACSSSSVTYVEDSTPPALPTLTGTDPVSPANDNNPKVKGSAEGGSTVKLYKAPTSSDCTGPNLAATGTDAAFAAPGLAASVADNSTTTFRATATDAVGNASSCSSSSIAYVENSTIPEAPMIVATNPSSPSASSTQPLVSGNASADTVTVEVFTQANCAGPAVSGSKAAFEGAGIQVTVGANQTTQLSARGLNGASAASACSSSFPYTHDSMAPAVPTITGSSPASPSNDSSPKLIGAAEGGSTVKLYTTAGCTGSPAATGAAATFSSPGITVSVSPNGTTTFKATATDAAGNASTCSSGLSYTHDNIAPAAPAITSTNPASPSNASTTPNAIGTSSSDTATVRVFTQAACAGGFTSGSKAGFEGSGIQVTVGANQTTQLSARALDAAGNPSPCSSNLPYTHDNLAPSAPTISSTNPASPSNTSTTPSVIGGSSADTVTVQVFTQASCAGGSTNGSKATFEGAGIQVTVGSNATTTLSAKAVDAVGNASTCSGGHTYTHDDIAPDAPAITGTDPVSPSNSTTKPLVKGTASSDTATVQVFILDACGGSPVGGTKAIFEGSGIQVGASANETTVLSARALDQAGNASDCSDSFPYTHDDIAPTSTIDDGPSGVTDEQTPTFEFHASEPASFQCSIDTGTPVFGPCSEPESSHTPPVPLTDGPYTFRVRATDPAANTGPAATRSFTVRAPDTTAPQTRVTKGPKKRTRSRRPKFRFASSEPTSTFRCRLDKKRSRPCASPFRPKKKLRVGKHVLRVQAIDAAGNVDSSPAVKKFRVVG